MATTPTLRTALAAFGLIALAGCARGAAEGETGALRIGAPTPVLQASAGALGLTYLRNALSRETLVAIAEDGRAVARVLDSWEVSADRLRWRLQLRSGVRFHDGTLLRAPDLAPQVARQLEQATLGAVRSVTAEGDNVLLVTLHEPYSFLLEDLAVLTALRNSGGQTFGTGPYEATQQTADHLSLRAVDGHYRGRPAIDRVDVRLFPDQRNAWSALMRDQVDMLYEVNRDSLEFIRGESGIRVATFPRPYVYLLGLNVDDPALADARVRQALDRAVNRDEFVRVAMAGEGEPAHGHVWPRHWTFDAKASAIDQDLSSSLELLDAAGLKLRRNTGRMPARLRIHCLVYEPLKEMGMVLQRQLAEIDVDLDLEVVPTSEFLDRITKGNFQSFVFEMASARGYKWPYQFWHSSTPYLKHGYGGADTILDAMRRAPDDAAFKAAAVAFQRRLHEDPPAIFLAWGRTSRAVSNRFEIPAGDEDIYHTIARWKLASRAGN
jgi:peptide/nickel transport system substrate-binding protein